MWLCIAWFHVMLHVVVARCAVMSCERTSFNYVCLLWRSCRKLVICPASADIRRMLLGILRRCVYTIRKTIYKCTSCRILGVARLVRSVIQDNGHCAPTSSVQKWPLSSALHHHLRVCSCFRGWVCFVVRTSSAHGQHPFECPADASHTYVGNSIYIHNSALARLRISHAVF